jgi:arylsulfatase A-like enzyme
MGNVSGVPGGNYYNWDYCIDGVDQGKKTDYLTTYTTNDAIYFAQTLPEPWFIYLPYHAIHSPWEPPTESLHGNTVTEDSHAWDVADAMLEALDTEIGRLLGEIEPDVLERTTIMIVGDNGTPDNTVPPPIRKAGDWGMDAKGTIYERGVHVPLIIVGPTIAQAGSESDALVHVQDIFPTAAEIAGVIPSTIVGAKPLDGHSFASVLEDVSATNNKDYLFIEKFKPIGGPPYSEESYYIRNQDYKLLEQEGTERFFDLTQDIDAQRNNLLNGTLTATEQAAYNDLRAELDHIITTIGYEY